MACGILAIAGTKALAHISYSTRDFGTVDSPNYGIDVSGVRSSTISGLFGWADATDTDWGDSHRVKGFRFKLANSLAADQSVRIIAERNLLGTGTTGTFLPGFSLFKGLAHTTSPLAHDSSVRSVQWLVSQFGDDNGSGLGGSGKEGSFNALGNWSIGNDPTTNTAASLASFTYIGHAADGTLANYGSAAGIFGDGNADGYLTATFTGLAAGDYSLFVGGADLRTTQTGPTYPTYGVNVTVGLVPEPSTGSLLLGGAALLTLLRRRKG